MDQLFGPGSMQLLYEDSLMDSASPLYGPGQSSASILLGSIGSGGGVSLSGLGGIVGNSNSGKKKGGSGKGPINMDNFDTASLKSQDDTARYPFMIIHCHFRSLTYSRCIFLTPFNPLLPTAACRRIL